MAEKDTKQDWENSVSSDSALRVSHSEFEKQKILIVDDKRENLVALRKVLTGVDAEIIETTSGNEALAATLDNDFAVAILDVNMPEMSGFELAEHLRGDEETAVIPIIFVTASLLDEQQRFKGYEAGGVDYIVKPYAPEVLRGKVRVFLEIAGYRRALQKHRDHLEMLVAERTATLEQKSEEVRIMTEQLWQTAKLATMGELAASIAHELNNPLQSISLRVESLLVKAALGEATINSLRVIEKEVERMGTLVSNLLQFSRRTHQQISSIDLSEEIAMTLELIHYHLRKRSVTVQQEIAPDVPLIQADRQQLRQVFLNLLTNASDAMPNGGTLTIRASLANEVPAAERVHSRVVIVEVSDTGEGIPSENLQKVMEPFFTTKPEGKGTGLGLAICRRIVHEHHGRITIESEVGKGTIVKVVLPIANNGNSGFLKEN